jgi:ABC-type sugar transport system substrate-binding protein
VKKMDQDVKVIGLGATPEGVEAIRKGELLATIDLKPKTQGSQALEILNSLAQKGVCPNGQKPPCPPNTVQPEIIGRETKH